MSRDSTSSALPVLAAGGIGGVIASLFCFCWLASGVAGAWAVRWSARARGRSLSSGEAFGVGVLTGVVLGGMTASLGTALFLSALDPAALEEAASMTESMLGESSDVSMGMLAVGHAMMAFMVNLSLGVMGAVVGAATQPPPKEVAPEEQPAFRFEPPPGWTPPEEEPTQVPKPSAEARAESPRVSEPSESFASALTSVAASGTPRPAPRQPPPETDKVEALEGELEEPEEPTIG